MLRCSRRLSVFWWFGSPRCLRVVGCGIVMLVMCSRQCVRIYEVSLAQLGWSFVHMTFVRSFLLTPMTCSLIGHPCQGPLWRLIRESKIVDVMVVSCGRLAARLRLVIGIPCIG